MANVRVGFIGTGIRGSQMMRDITTKMEGIEVVAVANRSQEKIDRLFNFYLKKASDEKKKAITVYHDYRELLKHKGLDGVVITTPDKTHVEIVKASLNKGLHVLCEKPLAITADDLAEMRADVEAHPDRAFVVGYVLRYAPIFRTIKEEIAKGTIGRPVHFTAIDSVYMGGHWFFRDWHRTKEGVTSLVIQKGCHTLDLMNWFAGAKPKRAAAFASRAYYGGDKPNDLYCKDCPDEDSCVDSVKSLTKVVGQDNMIDVPARCVFAKEIDIDDNFVAIVDYENGVRLAYTECHFAPDGNRTGTLTGTKGSIKYDATAMTLQFHKRGEKEPRQLKFGSASGHGGGDIGLIEDFRDAILGKSKPIATLDDGIRSVEVSLAALKSIKEGRVVELGEIYS